MQASWIEFAANDVARARDFYAAVFGHEAGEVIDDGTRAITLIAGEPTVSLNQTEGFAPGALGPLPMFEVDGSVTDAATRVVAAGGSVVEPTNERPGYGFFALVLDTEGNHLYLHSADV